MNAYFLSQFGYCPLVWMSHSREMKNLINHLHERALRVVYDECKSSFQQLLDMDNSVTIHKRNLQTLPCKIFKLKNKLSPEIMNKIFNFKESHYRLYNNGCLLSSKTVL